MRNMANFSHDNLSSNPEFNFLNILSNSSAADDDNSFISSDSPYNYTDISCEYMCETDFIVNFSNHRNQRIFMDIEFTAEPFVFY